MDPMRHVDVIHGDRRAERRYHFAMELRFTYQLKGVTYFGTGRTEDLSRYGVRFTSENPPPAGIETELRISWPFLLQNVCPLELIVWGPVRKTDHRGTILEMTNYEFRTCGERSFDQPVPELDRSSFIA
jgi:hypothetical protein